MIATVVPRGTGRAVCTAFVRALQTFGCPEEVLTDNGKQFTGRFTRPHPVEVLFERICRRNGIHTILTKPRSPTTTGKVERFHLTLQRDCLDVHGPFDDGPQRRKRSMSSAMTTSMNGPTRPSTTTSPRPDSPLFPLISATSWAWTSPPNYGPT